jgi:phosphate-selective porin OprO and OprP
MRALQRSGFMGAFLAWALSGSAWAQEVTSVQADAEEEAASTTYDEGFVFKSQDERFQLGIGGRVQPQWTGSVDDTRADEFQNRFFLRRARLVLDGHLFRDTRFKIQMEFGEGDSLLRDFYIDQKLGRLFVMVGQNKIPYSREQLNSSGALQFVDRSITDGFAGAGRDIGITVHNGYLDKRSGLGLAAGVYNGTGIMPTIDCEQEPTGITCGDPSNVPTDIGPLVAARMTWSHNGIEAYSSSDLEGGPLRLHGGVNYQVDLGEGSLDRMSHGAGMDALAKLFGASLSGAVFLRSPAEQMGDRDTFFGFDAAAGYMILPARLELAARYGQIPGEFVDDPRPGETQREYRLALNVFFKGHAWKWQTDYGVLQLTGAPQDLEQVVRSQVTFAF